MLYFILLKLLAPVIMTKSLINARCRRKFFLNDSSNMQKKQRKVARRRPKFLKYMVLFLSRRLHFLYENPTPPPWKIWWPDLKRCPLNCQNLATPTSFGTPKVQPLFSKGGGWSSYEITFASMRLDIRLNYIHESSLFW